VKCASCGEEHIADTNILQDQQAVRMQQYREMNGR